LVLTWINEQINFICRQLDQPYLQKDNKAKLLADLEILVQKRKLLLQGSDGKV
jgi:hypothetical protein